MKVALYARVSKAGLEWTKAHGNHLDRPGKRANMARAHELCAMAFGYPKTAKELGLSNVAVKGRMKEEGGESPNKTVPES